MINMKKQEFVQWTKEIPKEDQVRWNTIRKIQNDGYFAHSNLYWLLLDDTTRNTVSLGKLQFQFSLKLISKQKEQSLVVDPNIGKIIER
jgi:hypothetical protein